MQKVLRYLVLSALFLTFCKSAYAVTVSVDNYPQEITESPFSITVTVNGASPATNYLRVDLYKESTTNYFSETYNGADWFSGSDYTQYFKITIDSTKKWTGQIQARTGSPTITQYDTQGTYKLRVRRYTNSGGTDATEANNGAVSLNINIPKPSPTPSPTPNSSPSPQASASTAKSPTPTPQTTKSPTPTPYRPPEVLGENSSTPESSPSQSPLASPSTKEKENTKNNKTRVAAILTGSGAIIVGLSIAFFLWYRRVLESNGDGKN